MFQISFIRNFPVLMGLIFILCTPLDIKSQYISEDFESVFAPSLPAGWMEGDNGTGDGSNWLTFGLFGSTSAKQGAPTNANTETWMMTSLINLSGSGSVQLSFDANQSNPPANGSYEIRVNNNPGSQGNYANYNLVQAYSVGQMSNSTVNYTVDLSTYDGQQIYIAFVFRQGATSDHTWFIDNIVVDDPTPKIFSPEVWAITEDYLLTFPGGTGMPDPMLDFSFPGILNGGFSTSGGGSTLEGYGSIADGSTGEMLMYTDGNKVFDGNNNLTNTLGLTIGSPVQNGMILPVPGTSNIVPEYFIFSINNLNDLYYTRVNSDGSGILSGPTLIHNNVMEVMAATRHANGSDYWLVTHTGATNPLNNNEFQVYNLTSTGITAPAQLFNRGASHMNNSRGQLKFNPYGNKIGMANEAAGQVDVFWFNKATGSIDSQVQSVSGLVNPVGFEFSQDGMYAYFNNGGSDIHMLNLSSGAQNVVAAGATSYPGGLQIGPDCGVYFTNQVAGKMGRIDHNSGAPVVNSNWKTGITVNNGLPTLESSLLGGACFALPVELVDFTAEYSEGKVLLAWQTASEFNNDYFIVERSRDGGHWEEVAQVFGSGNSTDLNRYGAEDINPERGVSYYRLTQVDFNGAIQVFNNRIQSLRVETHLEMYLREVSSSGVQLVLNSERPQIVKIEILNNLGKIVSREERLIQKGYQEISLPATLSKGVFFARCFSEAQIENLKFNY